jgi:metallo-beta-lactamase family protein
MEIKFLGATETVTGSKHLLITDSKKQVLLDCGLYQGLGKKTFELNEHLDINPSEIEAVILSHAHIDHSGNLPLLVKQGFLGHIYCTPATYDLCEVLLMDSAHIQEADIEYFNKKRQKLNKPKIKPLYTTNDVEKCLKRFKTIPYNSKFYINDELSFKFINSGHILGSASVYIENYENGKTQTITYTGDVGRYTDLLIKDPDSFPQSDYILCESTYGDRLHEVVQDMEKKLLSIITETCIEKKGKLIIPAFSLGRTQEIVFVLDKLEHQGLLPPIKVFVDSPMSTSATEITKKHLNELRESLVYYAKNNNDPFGFEKLTYVKEASESKKLNDLNEPCIIISASGMMDAGRIKHHLKKTISNEKNTILVVGYCSPLSLGSKIMNGDKEVKLFGEMYPVKAKIEIMNSFSAHADYSELIKFLSCQDKNKVKEIFLIHGEENSKTVFRNTLLKEGYKKVSIPSNHDIIEL